MVDTVFERFYRKFCRAFGVKNVDNLKMIKMDEFHRMLFNFDTIVYNLLPVSLFVFQ